MKNKHEDTLMRDIGLMLLTWAFMLAAWMWDSYDKGETLLTALGI